MTISTAHGALSDVCCEQNADPKKQTKAIKALLKKGADIQETDKNGVTPLHFAVRFRSPAAVETLLAHGARVNQVCKRSGSTPLHRAVTTTGAPSTAGKQTEVREIIELLLKFGADPSIKNKNGKRPADYVRDEQILRLLKKTKRT
jgi:ankyrin repeat protein